MEKEEKQRLRKERKQGVVTQKMITFRCDYDNVEILNRVANKGRYINEAIRCYFGGIKKD